MRRLNRYISRTILMATFIVLFVLVGIDLLSLVITESRNIVRDYTLAKVMLYVAWSVPSTILEHIANAAFLGCVIGLGVHANANELVVIRSAGVGMRRLMWAVFRPVLLLAIVALILNEYVTPHTLRQAEAVQVVAKGQVHTLQSGQGHWHVERDADSGNNIFIFFRGLNRNLFDIVRYELGPNNQQLVKSRFAEQAVFYSAQNQWELERSSSSTIPLMTTGADDTLLVEERVIHEPYLRESWVTSLTPDVVNDIALLPEQLSISRLYRRAASLDKQLLESRDYWLSFWQKVFQPLSIVGLTLVGISFVFGSMREISIWQRSTIALLIGIVLDIFQELLARSSLVYQFSPLIAILVPIVMCFVVGTYLLRRR